MMYIGTSLGGCIFSIMSGEVSEDDVMVIITRTDCPNYESYIAVVKAYYAQGNPGASHPERYEYGHWTLESVLDLAQGLWQDGKIHQPRTMAGSTRYKHPFAYGDRLWFQVVPTIDNDNPAVVDAYEKYKMLDILTR